jgi:hypothetical protein
MWSKGKTSLFKKPSLLTHPLPDHHEGTNPLQAPSIALICFACLACGKKERCYGQTPKHQAALLAFPLFVATLRALAL